MSDDLQPLTSSYRVGKSRGIGQSTAARGSIYNEALNRVLLQRLPAAELARYRGVMRAVSTGLAQARAGELAAARTTLAGFLEEAGACAETVLLARSFVAAALAYVDYRSGHWLRARAELVRSFRADDRLVVEYGYDLMNAHQIQLAINVVRGEAARGRPGRAVRLAALLLDHLRGASDELPAPLPVTRPPLRLAALPATLVEVLAAQTLGEVALALATVVKGFAGSSPVSGLRSGRGHPVSGLGKCGSPQSPRDGRS